MFYPGNINLPVLWIKTYVSGVFNIVFEKYCLCEFDSLNTNANYSGVEYDSVQKMCAQIYWWGRMQTAYRMWNIICRGTDKLFRLDEKCT
jgi:hypothetical protein